MRRLFGCGVLVVCSAVLGCALGRGPARPAAAIETDAFDRLLADFAAATAKLDVPGAERLFLAPDGTAAGQSRQGHLTELRKDWTRARGSGADAGPSVQFINVSKIIRAEMRINRPGDSQRAQVQEVEFVVASTTDGWKIVSMNTGPPPR